MSFSFVNEDLRNFFRVRFPFARWFLVDTDVETAGRRIRARRGHFYTIVDGASCGGDGSGGEGKKMKGGDKNAGIFVEREKFCSGKVSPCSFGWDGSNR